MAPLLWNWLKETVTPKLHLKRLDGIPPHFSLSQNLELFCLHLSLATERIKHDVRKSL